MYFVRKLLLVLLAIAFIGGCATVPVPENWSEPIAPKMSLPFEVERPWEALAIRHAEGKLFSVAIPKEWYRTQFPFVPVKEPESREIVPLQRMVSRVILYCRGVWVQSSAVINQDRYDVLLPKPCNEGDNGMILAGNGKHVLTLGGDIVRNIKVERLLKSTEYREQFFSAHPSVVHSVHAGQFSAPVLKQLNQIIVVDGTRFRIGFETVLAVMITVGGGIGERFLDCGGGDVNVVSAIVIPGSTVVKAGIALICAATGQPTGLFLPEDDNKLTEERVTP